MLDRLYSAPWPLVKELGEPEVQKARANAEICEVVKGPSGIWYLILWYLDVPGS